jgi:hypothetical protein
MDLNLDMLFDSPSSQDSIISVPETSLKRKNSDDESSSPPKKKLSQRWNSETLKSAKKLMEYALQPTTPSDEIQACLKKILQITKSQRIQISVANDSRIKRLKTVIHGTLRQKAHF